MNPSRKTYRNACALAALFVCLVSTLVVLAMALLVPLRNAQAPCPPETAVSVADDVAAGQEGLEDAEVVIGEPMEVVAETETTDKNE